MSRKKQRFPRVPLLPIFEFHDTKEANYFLFPLSLFLFFSFSLFSSLLSMGPTAAEGVGGGLVGGGILVSCPVPQLVENETQTQLGTDFSGLLCPASLPFAILQLDKRTTSERILVSRSRKIPPASMPHFRTTIPHSPAKHRRRGSTRIPQICG